ncbi:hypothetical protein CMV30_17360 [Nibricoccus aquaticus]|uniref:Acyltransferase 3 domain-containing protein n=1 Tax=Nibricoccus aquaticus TaxID=2576891 RepID=A0A290QAM2_9BACT|nr:acyltransferase family protein [Nibricoccus aquaticus]ATC65574.1 hypothetical protein CMV30_17360 [Nibricoccus aquaticus]
MSAYPIVSSAADYSNGAASAPAPASSPRLHYLDAARAFALLLGVVFHASLSFMPAFIGWAVMDVSTSALVPAFVLMSHAFRMETFFLLAGFFSQLALSRQKLAHFIGSRFLRIGVPFVAGWFILRPLIVSGWVMGRASMSGDYDFGAALHSGFQDIARLPEGLFTGTHLWFLYYLNLITALALMIRVLGQIFRQTFRRFLRFIDHAFSSLISTRACLPGLVVPTAAALWFMNGWGMDTPDRTLSPHLPALLIYSGFFLAGWLAARREGLLDRFARLTWSRGVITVIAIATTLLLSNVQMNPATPRYELARATFCVSYAAMMWLLVSLTLGVFKKLNAGPIRLTRYLADSAYWIYLVHLPVVVWLQVMAAELPLHGLMKLAGISLITLATGLLTYDLFVRSTALGQLLSGRRSPRVIPGLFRRTSRPAPQNSREQNEKSLSPVPAARAPIIKPT